ncbi:MAG: hypothetical protein PWP28_527 [Oceanotoga sp.]|uniref:DUF721 domain-containing protein n=1 Tax=Oceanotoga sp. TaxID=2108366 RepID=UPI00264A5792|nr:DUF721 domain-containing protein [Oceanotoga sp.]MDN5341652.1 hypothetical protein [Oceanotoga sp.]
MDFIGDILKKMSKKDNVIKKVYNISIIKKNWNELFTDKLNIYTEPVEYYPRDKILIISCQDNIVMQEMLFLRKQVIDKINSYFNEVVVKEIKVIRRCIND